VIDCSARLEQAVLQHDKQVEECAVPEDEPSKEKEVSVCVCVCEGRVVRSWRMRPARRKKWGMAVISWMLVVV